MRWRLRVPLLRDLCLLFLRSGCDASGFGAASGATLGRSVLATASTDPHFRHLIWRPMLASLAWYSSPHGQRIVRVAMSPIYECAAQRIPRYLALGCPLEDRHWLWSDVLERLAVALSYPLHEQRQRPAAAPEIGIVRGLPLSDG